jgi:hypothetical protein
MVSRSSANSLGTVSNVRRTKRRGRKKTPSKTLLRALSKTWVITRNNGKSSGKGSGTLGRQLPTMLSSTRATERRRKKAL